MPRLRVIRANSEDISLPRYLVVETAIEATAAADEIALSIAAIEQRIWSGDRAAAINELNRAGYRVEQMRGALAELAGLADRAPTEPGAAAAVA